MEIIGKLGLRFPPANSVDRDAHAARVALLAEDCADIPSEWLAEAVSRWAKSQPFFPRTCELRADALAYGRLAMKQHALPVPRRDPLPTPQEPPPLTDDEIARMSPALVAMGIKVGALDVDRVARLRHQDEVAPCQAIIGYAIVVIVIAQHPPIAVMLGALLGRGA